MKLFISWVKSPLFFFFVSGLNAFSAVDTALGGQYIALIPLAVAVITWHLGVKGVGAAMKDAITAAFKAGVVASAEMPGLVDEVDTFEIDFGHDA